VNEIDRDQLGLTTLHGLDQHGSKLTRDFADQIERLRLTPRHNNHIRNG
jgi:hypothetical protein